jgi:beta-phosphoglucomutase-like phosphatase (HAD superfamily)
MMNPNICAVLFDMDGVLASVGNSYREAIIQTCARFGCIITQEMISLEKKKGNANNDWIHLTIL